MLRRWPRRINDDHNYITLCFFIEAIRRKNRDVDCGQIWNKDLPSNGPSARFRLLERKLNGFFREVAVDARDADGRRRGEHGARKRDEKRRSRGHVEDRRGRHEAQFLVHWHNDASDRRINSDKAVEGVEDEREIFAFRDRSANRYEARRVGCYVERTWKRKSRVICDRDLHWQRFEGKRK